MPNHCLEPNQNEDLASERRLCPFNTLEMTARIYGGENFVKSRQKIQKYVQSVPELRECSSDFSFLSRLETLERTARNAVVLMKHAPKICDPNEPFEFEYLRKQICGDDGYPYGLHNSMVVPMLKVNCSEEQMNLWLPKALNGEFIGTYAQTEMAHGTNLKKLETTATYDPETKEFVMNSPTISSAKWIPGNLGKSSNFILVMAQLWTQGKCYGPHAFMVQIRDPVTHMPMPGVEVGDIGPKIGINSNDNGYLRLHNIRIPRLNMLMGNSQVTPEGKFIPPAHAKLAYTSMMFVRSVMIHLMGQGLGAAACIATRYACVRRQGEVLEGQGEVKILDYQTHQYRILPQISRAYAFIFAGHYSKDLYFRVMEDVKRKDTSLMADLHALNSGLKSVVSWQASQGVEQCRLGCGGHGYTCASALPQIYGLVVGGCTYEGENLVMLLQLARYLMKLAPQIVAGRPNGKISEIAQYLFEKKPTKSRLQKNQSREAQWEAIQEGFEHVARRLTLEAYQRLSDLKKNGVPHEVAWTKVGLDLSRASKAHTRTFLTRIFINSVKNEKTWSLKEVLSDVLHLYLHYELQDCRADVLEDGYLSNQQAEISREELAKALEAVRKNAVNLVDAFDFQDRELNSQLGRKDGNVYENLWKWAQNSEVNKYQVLPFHHETTGKIMKDAQRQHSKL
ncbi:unnamed protein product [Bursaphelenchus xylophilus]|uniref:Acyl-coenzyme A oxidase n=1 Tax=Bursaphelenchus xylophilus TaxID=6326 RepID=A0A1I7RJR7_BURXY|nr:unnamed protein product [Bursaphelenchus xylophilus]CAD5233701.1 unnamed protein product [Bursaphelenchus xylophilus]CAG9129011.1 unnamed protein product [Bursaphelenchus xylophilus]CAG9129019.1 unnamed protein product [Bursaphelenchus xylophilus]